MGATEQRDSGKRGRVIRSPSYRKVRLQEMRSPRACGSSWVWADGSTRGQMCERLRDALSRERAGRALPTSTPVSLSDGAVDPC